MLTLTLLMVGSLAQTPSPAPNPCTVLTAQEIASVIGAAKQMPIMATPTGGSCMYQNGDKLVTVLLVVLVSEDAAKGQYEAKKRVSAGADVAGWPTPAYAATIEQPKQHVALVGLLKAKTFVEVKAMDLSQKAADLTAKLQTVMKALSGRM